MKWTEKRDRCRKAFGNIYTDRMTPQCRVYSRYVDNCNDCSFKWVLNNPLPRL